jgi:hypothetical protein
MSFATPSAPSGGLDFKSLLGCLLLIEVLSFEDHVPTVHTKPGEKSPAVRANVAVIDGQGAGDTYDDTLIFPKILVSQTKNNVGQKVLGRLAQGQGKPGQSPPWVLNAAGPEDIAKAEAWVQQNTQPTVTSAAPPF